MIEHSPQAPGTGSHPLELVPGVAVTELLVPVGLAATWDRGLQVAARYARSWQLPIRVLHVVEGHGPTVDATVDPDAAREVELAARRLAAMWQVDVTGEVVPGDDLGQAVEAATVLGSVVVLATDHVDRLAHPGSDGERIVRATDNPVVLSGPRCLDAPASGSVVVALDGSAWAEAAIEPATLAARRFDATLWVVHVTPESTVAHAERLRSDGHQVSVSAYVRDVAERLEARGVTAGWEVVQGPAASGIVQFATDREASLIVATTHGETGLARRVLGSVTMAVVREAPMPVLVVPTEPVAASELP